MKRRTTMTIDLTPVAGSRFQPTGFPNLGAARFDRPAGDGKWVAGLHVESPQSMANRFELTTWDVAAKEQRDALGEIPYVEVVTADGEFLTSSRLEAHRLACAYIMDATTADGTAGSAWLETRLGLTKGAAIDHQRLAGALFDLDPLSLIHGVFFARKGWPWQPKVARAITCFIDADDVRVAASGGVKTDSVNTEGGATDAGYGMVPHQRTEFTAQSITAFVTIDHEQLASYGLGAQRTALLEALINFELANTFHPDGLRLRTACDLKLVGPSPLLSPEQAEEALGEALAAVDGLLGERTIVTWKQRTSKKPGTEA